MPLVPRQARRGRTTGRLRSLCSQPSTEPHAFRVIRSLPTSCLPTSRIAIRPRTVIATTSTRLAYGPMSRRRPVSSTYPTLPRSRVHRAPTIPSTRPTARPLIYVPTYLSSYCVRPSCILCLSNNKTISTQRVTTNSVFNSFTTCIPKTFCNGVKQQTYVGKCGGYHGSNNFTSTTPATTPAPHW